MRKESSQIYDLSSIVLCLFAMFSVPMKTFVDCIRDIHVYIHTLVSILECVPYCWMLLDLCYRVLLKDLLNTTPFFDMPLMTDWGISNCSLWSVCKAYKRGGVGLMTASLSGMWLVTGFVMIFVMWLMVGNEIVLQLMWHVPICKVSCRYLNIKMWHLAAPFSISAKWLVWQA